MKDKVFEAAVYYLNDPEELAIFHANHNRINQLNQQELIKMILIYNQWVLALLDVIEANNKNFNNYVTEINKIVEQNQ